MIKINLRSFFDALVQYVLINIIIIVYDNQKMCSRKIMYFHSICTCGNHVYEDLDTFEVGGKMISITKV